MKMYKELKKIDQYIGTDVNKFNECYAYLVNEYPSDKGLIDDYIELSLYNFTSDIKNAVDEIGMKVRKAHFTTAQNFV